MRRSPPLLVLLALVAGPDACAHLLAPRGREQKRRSARVRCGHAIWYSPRARCRPPIRTSSRVAPSPSNRRRARHRAARRARPGAAYFHNASQALRGTDDFTWVRTVDPDLGAGSFGDRHVVAPARPLAAAANPSAAPPPSAIPPTVQSPAPRHRRHLLLARPCPRW